MASKLRYEVEGLAGAKLRMCISMSSGPRRHIRALDTGRSFAPDRVSSSSRAALSRLGQLGPKAHERREDLVQDHRRVRLPDEPRREPNNRTVKFSRLPYEGRVGRRAFLHAGEIDVTLRCDQRPLTAWRLGRADDGAPPVLWPGRGSR
jgi:hypothetical protein